MSMSSSQKPATKPVTKQDSSSEEFEQLAESKEQVEKNLFKSKLVVVNLTLT